MNRPAVGRLTPSLPTIARMLSHINGGRSDGTYVNWLRKFTRPTLLILDEFCLKPLKDQEPGLAVVHV